MNIGGLSLSANHNIKQVIEVCEEPDKEDKLNALLKQIASDRNNKIIVFVETKKKVDDITKAVKSVGEQTFTRVFSEQIVIILTR